MKSVFVHLGILLAAYYSIQAQPIFPIVGYGIYHTVGGRFGIHHNVWPIVTTAGYNTVHFITVDDRPDSVRGIIAHARGLGLESVPSFGGFNDENTGIPTRGFEYLTRGRRWRYQLEYTNHFGGANRRGAAITDVHGPDEILAAVKDAEVYSSTLVNCWQVDAGQDSSGFLGRLDVAGGVQKTDTLHVRVRMRMPDYENATPGDTVLIIRILIDQQTITRYITTDSTKRVPWNNGMGNRLRDDNMYGEVDCGFFVKPTTTTPYAIELEWTGKATAHIDYVAIDNAYADELFSGRIWDHAIDTELARFGLCISY